MLLNKKAAMFGLDARIALAIFAVLSVITGAALYSVIKKIEATTFLMEMREIGKAWEQFYIDTGSNLEPFNPATTEDNFYLLKSANLVTNLKSDKNWKGPYLSYSTPAEHSLDHPKYFSINVLTLTNEQTWGGAIAWQTGGKCTSAKKCYVWVQINGLNDDNLAKRIDKIVDNSDGEQKGSFRWWTAGLPPENYRYDLLIAPVKNPHD